MYTLLYVKWIVVLPKWSESERWEWRQNMKSGATGQGTCSLYWTEVQSPLWVQLLILIADYKTFLILSFPRHYTDIVQITLFLTQAIPFWASLGNNEQVHKQHSGLTPALCSKVHAFMIPVILPSGSGLGVYNKIIVNKNMEDNH